VLIALAIVGLIMIAMNTFVFSMGELWGRGSEVRLFDLHVRNVSRFLERELRSATFSTQCRRGHEGAVSVREIKSASGLESPLLTFELREGGRLMVWPEHASARSHLLAGGAGWGGVAAPVALATGKALR
jgi:hypothetical protein